jgi:hypothetical protein
MDWRCGSSGRAPKKKKKKKSRKEFSPRVSTKNTARLTHFTLLTSKNTKEYICVALFP